MSGAVVLIAARAGVRLGSGAQIADRARGEERTQRAHRAVRRPDEKSGKSISHGRCPCDGDKWCGVRPSVGAGSDNIRRITRHVPAHQQFTPARQLDTSPRGVYLVEKNQSDGVPGIDGLTTPVDDSSLARGHAPHETPKTPHPALGMAPGAGSSLCSRSFVVTARVPRKRPRHTRPAHRSGRPVYVLSG